MAPSREFVPLSEVANKWNRQENDLIDWAIQKQFNLYYYWRSQRGGLWVIIVEELGCFLRGEDSVSCSNYGIPIRPINKVPFTTRNEQPVYLKINYPIIIPIYYSVSLPPLDISTSPSSFLDFPMEIKKINKSDLFLHRDEIADMEGCYPSLLDEKTESYNKITTSSNVNKSDTRIEKTDLYIIGGLVELLKGEHVRKKLPYRIDSDIIEDLTEYSANGLIKKRTVQQRFARAKKIMRIYPIKDRADLYIIGGLVEISRGIHGKYSLPFSKNVDIIDALANIFKDINVIDEKFIKERFDKAEKILNYY